MSKKTIVIILIVVVALVVLYFILGNIFYNIGINANVDKDFLNNNDALDNKNVIGDDVAKEAREKDLKFLEENKSEEINIISRDKLKLNLVSDLYRNNDSNKWAILVHGYNGHGKTLTRFIRNFHDQGYNVIAPDLRGHGRSEGSYIGMGWDDRLDILSWIDEIVKLDKDAQIVLWGISMGATSVMNVSGEYLPENVKVIIEDCGYNSAGDIFTYQLKELYNLPKFPVINAANTVTKIRAGYDIFESNAEIQLEKNKTPMLFIHGSEDKFVPFEMLDIVYNKTDAIKEKVVVEGAKHGHSEMVDPKLYWTSIWNFIDENLR